jgi:SRSO17 transposase
MARAQIRRAVEEGVSPGVVLADAASGIDGQFGAGVTELEREYVLGVQSSTTVWEPGQQPLPAKPWKGRGRFDRPPCR